MGACRSRKLVPVLLLAPGGFPERAEERLHRRKWRRTGAGIDPSSKREIVTTPGRGLHVDAVYEHGRRTKEAHRPRLLLRAYLQHLRLLIDSGFVHRLVQRIQRLLEVASTRRVQYLDLHLTLSHGLASPDACLFRLSGLLALHRQASNDRVTIGPSHEKGAAMSEFDDEFGIDLTGPIDEEVMRKLMEQTGNELLGTGT